MGKKAKGVFKKKKQQQQNQHKNRKPAIDDEDEIISSDIDDAFERQQDKIIFGENDNDLSDDGFSDTSLLDLPAQDDDDDEEDGEEEEEEGWGKSKKAYYSADQNELDAEVQEVKRLQKKKAESLRMQDFLNDDDDNKQQLDYSSTSFSRQGPVKLEFSSDDEDPPVIDIDNNNPHLKVEELVKNDPELKKLYEELNALHKELEEHLQPLLEKLQSSHQDRSSDNKGLEFLQAKSHLLAGYCANIGYYLWSRASGMETSPKIMKQLVRYRLLIEKLKPIESKLRYQIEKLVKAASSEGIVNKNNDNNELDPLSFRPNLDDSILMNDLTMLTNDLEDDDDDSNNLYKAPKIIPMHYPGDNHHKKKKDSETKQDRDMDDNNRWKLDDEDDNNDLPDKENIDIAYKNKNKKTQLRKIREMDEYEEENFVRLDLTKKEKRKLKDAATTPIDELDDLDAYIDEVEENNKQKKEKSMATTTSTNANEKFPPKQQQKKEKDNHQYEIPSDESEIESSSSTSNEPQEKYNNNKNAKGKNKFNTAYPRTSSSSSVPVKYRNQIDMKEPFSKRPINKDILKNRGLVPYRSKQASNPRIKQRNRFEKAQKRMIGFKPITRNNRNDDHYSGERTGIRTNVSKSIKF